jgi:glucose-6-phosphate 1-dehydrogenase
MTPPSATVILFGATGDLARRKLLPGLLHLFETGLLADIEIVGASRDDLTDEDFRSLAETAVNEFGRTGADDRAWPEFAQRLHGSRAGAVGLAEAVAKAEVGKEGHRSRLHYLSVPPQAALGVVGTIREADLVTGSRIVMEKPFGVDVESARTLNAALHEVFDETQIYRIDHFLGKEAAQNILAFRFANGLFEPIWHRNHIDHVQIDIPETLGVEDRGEFYEDTGAYKDMVVTHLFQVMAFVAMEPPTSLTARAIQTEKAKVFHSMLPLDPVDVVRGQYDGYRAIDGVDPDSDTETFIALKCFIDNWRWAGVPFYLRTGKRLAEGTRIVSIAFKEPPKSMFPDHCGLGDHGPDHLTFDLADSSRMSLSFYGKRPGPGMQLDKLSMQFATHDTQWAGSVLEAYERLILDAIRGDQTLFTSAEGIERLWEVSAPLAQHPPVIRRYPQGSWGPNQIHQLIAPRTWRLPFEREWRDPNPTGA